MSLHICITHDATITIKIINIPITSKSLLCSFSFFNFPIHFLRSSRGILSGATTSAVTYQSLLSIISFIYRCYSTLCLFSVCKQTSISIFSLFKTKHLHLEVHQSLFSASWWFQASNLQWQKCWRELQQNKVLGRENSLSHSSLCTSLPSLCLFPPNCCTPFSAFPTESCVSNFLQLQEQLLLLQRSPHSWLSSCPAQKIYVAGLQQRKIKIWECYAQRFSKVSVLASA